MRIWNKIGFNHSSVIAALLTLAAGTMVAPPVLAGGSSRCHFHGSKPATEETVLRCADMHKARLIENGKIESAWASVKHESVQQIDAKEGKKEWKVTFKDAAAKDKTKETLFMFFSVTGNFLASNFTGN